MEPLTATRLKASLLPLPCPADPAACCGLWRGGSPRQRKSAPPRPDTVRSVRPGAPAGKEDQHGEGLPARGRPARGHADDFLHLHLARHLHAPGAPAPPHPRACPRARAPHATRLARLNSRASFPIGSRTRRAQARLPKGPTLTFKVHSYTLAREGEPTRSRSWLGVGHSRKGPHSRSLARGRAQSVLPRPRREPRQPCHAALPGHSALAA